MKSLSSVIFIKENEIETNLKKNELFKKQIDLLTSVCDEVIIYTAIDLTLKFSEKVNIYRGFIDEDDIAGFYNRGIYLATKDYIFVLDEKDEIDEVFSTRLLNLKKVDFNNFDCISLKDNNEFLPIYKGRIFNRKKHPFYIGNIAQTLTIEGDIKKQQIGACIINHTDKNDIEKQWDKYVNLSTSTLSSDNDLFIFSLYSYLLDKVDDATRCFTALVKKNSIKNDVKSLAYSLLSNLTANQESELECLYLSAAHSDILRSDVAYNLAYYYYNKGVGICKNNSFIRSYYLSKAKHFFENAIVGTDFDMIYDYTPVLMISYYEGLIRTMLLQINNGQNTDEIIDTCNNLLNIDSENIFAKETIEKLTNII